MVRLSTVEARLGRMPAAAENASLAGALATLAAAASKPQATTRDLDFAASAFMQVGPPALRRPELSVQWA